MKQTGVGSNCYERDAKRRTPGSPLAPPTALPGASLLLSGCFELSWGPALETDLSVYPPLSLPSLLTHPNETQQSGSYSSDLGPLPGQFNIGVARC